MFLGEYVSQMDKDKRNTLIIPAEFRGELGREGFIAKGVDNYLCIYPEKEWEKLIEKWKQLPLEGIKYRKFWRAISSGATEIMISGEGRCFIPRYLKEHANLQNEIVFLGCNEYIEIWDKRRWEKEEKEIFYKGGGK